MVYYHGQNTQPKAEVVKGML